MKNKIIPSSRFTLANIVPLLCAIGIAITFFAVNWWQTTDITATPATITFATASLVVDVPDADVNADAIISQVLVLPNMPRIASLGIVLAAAFVGGGLALFSIFKPEIGHTVLSAMNILGGILSRINHMITSLVERWSLIGRFIAAVAFIVLYLVIRRGELDLILVIGAVIIGTDALKWIIFAILGVIGMVVSIIAGLLRLPFESTTGRSIGLAIATAGLVIWVYYFIYITQNSLPDEVLGDTLNRILGISGSGFLIIFALSTGLVMQFFLPRAGVEYYTAPWWLVVLFLLWVSVVVIVPFNDDYNAIYSQLQEGISLTIYLAFTSYLIAIVLGLFTGIVRANPPQPPTKMRNQAKPDSPFKVLLAIVFYPFAVVLRLSKKIISFELPALAQESITIIARARIGHTVRRILHTILYNAVTFYVEFMRGIPPLVFLLISGFIIVPGVRDAINLSLLPFLRDFLNNPEIPDMVWRGRDAGTAIAGLSLVYGAFLSEVFRAGIQSIDKGQIEAAKSLGMRYFQVMRFIVIPQAVRRMLPPLGNNFISMVKDTSLVTILGTNEITQIARKWSGSTFLYVETYLVLSLIYLTMTITGSLLVQLMERQLKRHER